MRFTIPGDTYEKTILLALHYEGPLGLKALRTSLFQQLNIEIPLETVKREAMRLVERGAVSVRRKGNGYLFTLGTLRP